MIKQTVHELVNASKEASINHFSQLIDIFRRAYKSKGINAVNEHLDELIYVLETESELRTQFKEYLNQLFGGLRNEYVLSELGIQPPRTFTQELKGIAKRKILPEVWPQDSLQYWVNRVFNHHSDYLWLQQLDRELFKKLFLLLEISHTIDEHSPVGEKFVNAAIKLSSILCALGLEYDVSERLSEIERQNSPFREQNRELLIYIEKLHDKKYATSPNNVEYKQIKVLLNQCISAVIGIEKRRKIHGASLELSYKLNRMLQIAARLKLVLDILHTEGDEHVECCIGFMQEVVKANNLKNSISHLFNTNITSLSREIAMNEGVTGEHYITTSRNEYVNFFLSASGGGFIVAFLVWFKSEAHHLHAPIFWEAFLYSANYALGFILIHITGSTLATKQPAMTASTIAHSLDSPHLGTHSLKGLALMIAKISRSQLVAFAGNLLVAFPVAYVLSWFFNTFFDYSVYDEHMCMTLVNDLPPFMSPVVFFAAVAGVYLFVSGIISGYYDNSALYNKIPQRVAQHPVLLKILGEKNCAKFAHYIGHNLGSLAGNFFFGILLGTALAIGKILGIPYDIRHVTFSTAQFGFALQQMPELFSLQNILMCTLGIVLIGFTNFIVSFSLALIVAIKSRGVKFSQGKHLLGFIFTYFRKFPLDFFYPPKIERTAEHVWGTIESN